MKLCLVIPSLNAGGMERVMTELAGYFASRNFEVHLIKLGKGNSFYSVVPEVTIHEPDFTFNNGFRLYYTLKTLKFLRKKLISIKPGSVLSFGEMYNSFVLLSSLGLKLRIFVSDRSRPDKKWGILHEQLRRLLYRKAAGIISQTEYSKSVLTKLTGHEKIRVISNPVKSHAPGNFSRKNIVLFIGRLVSTKRVDLLIEAFSKSYYPGWELWILGDGPQSSNLKDLSKKMGLSEVVKFWGNQSDIGQYYRQAKIFAFPSISEGFPNALLEALSYGLACIAFDCKSGPSELLINNYNGFLIPLLDNEDFIAKLRLLISDETLIKRFSANAVLAAEPYSLDNIGHQYLSFITS